MTSDSSLGPTLVSNGLQRLSSGAPSPRLSKEQAVLVVEPGTQPDHVYDNTLPWWRAAIRRLLIRSLKYESRWIGVMQKHVRTPTLDTYFVYTSTLGTHTFFMTVLPMFFFFGYPKVGRGLIYVLSAGVYFSSFIKDSICVPRPYVPPVTRLTIGTHHLEYGFPSTHSTNSISIALFAFGVVSNLPPIPLLVAGMLLSLYTCSIVYGRLYCGMHSFTDCTFGMLLGTLVSAAQWKWGDIWDGWAATQGPMVPLIIIPVGLFLVNQHAEPVDDCPCFEDAIAFVSVVMGIALGRWHAFNYGMDEDSGFFVSRMPGWQLVTVQDWATWLAFAAVKTVVGVMIIFTWRLVVKAGMLAVLPPIYRFVAQGVSLPNRRFYTPATEYKSVPSDNGLHPIPSVIDLPSQIQAESPSLHPSLANGSIAKQRLLQVGKEKETDASDDDDIEVVEDRTEPVKHYDAAVITKVVVYCGIGWLAGEGIPVLFEFLAWGVLQGPPW